VPLSALDERLQQQARRSRRRSSVGLPSRRTVRRVLWLATGLLVVLGLVLAGWTAVRMHQRKAAEANAAAAARRPPSRPTPPPAPAPAPRLVASDDPAVIVREMLKASVANDTATAYAYWGIQPTDIAYYGATGLQATLVECTAKAQASAKRVRLDECQFRVQRREDQTARVGQYTRSICTQVYVLRRAGGTWKVMSCAQP
jgi:hypothetical protein